MATVIRIIAFGALGVVIGLSGCGINTWQFWSLIGIASVIYICGRVEEHKHR